MKELCKDKIEKFANKGIKTYLRAMVVGVPNSGKSTLINNLCGKAKTITGDKAGVTRGKQWLSLKNGFEVLDTPGTLWPNFEDETVAHNLALIGSVKNEVVDMGELCISLLRFMINNYKDNLEEKYNIKILLQPNEEYDVVEYVEVIDLIAKRKNHMLKGGETDYDRACFAIVDDFRKGKLGFVSLEKLI